MDGIPQRRNTAAIHRDPVIVEDDGELGRVAAPAFVSGSSSAADLNGDRRDLIGDVGPLEEISLEGLRHVAENLLRALGQDLSAEDLRDTPRRFARWWKEFLEFDAGDLDRSFEFSRSAQLVAVSGVRVWSICAHHLLPFWCDISVGYRPKSTILGLSKFARCAHKHAHRPQLQERLCSDIADEIEDLSGSPDVIVVGRGEHLCMTMRGIRAAGIVTATIARGAFEHDGNARTEFLRVVS